MPKDRTGIVNTKRGVTHYYTVKGMQKDRLAFFIRFDDDDPKMTSEIEFYVQDSEYSVEQLELFVRLFSDAYDRGIGRGRWEKAKRYDELMTLIKREGLGSIF
jgi:hypothetical protein